MRNKQYACLTAALLLSALAPAADAPNATAPRTDGAAFQIKEGETVFKAE